MNPREGLGEESLRFISHRSSALIQAILKIAPEIEAAAKNILDPEALNALRSLNTRIRFYGSP
jgi:hypothetical protein